MGGYCRYIYSLLPFMLDSPYTGLQRYQKTERIDEEPMVINTTIANINNLDI